METNKLKNAQISNTNKIIGGSSLTAITVARNTSDLPRDRNNVQNPFRAIIEKK